MRKTQSGLWIDSIHPIDITDLEPLGYEALLSAAINIMSFLSYLNPIRAALVNIYLNQAVFSPTSIYDGTVTSVSEYKSKLLMISLYLDKCHSDLLSSIPGLNLYILFMNNELTYEYGLVINISAAKRFKYIAYHKIMISVGSTNVLIVGDIIDPFESKWCHNVDQGKLISIKCVTIGSFRVKVHELAVNGRKCNTLYGSKGVFTILPDHMMPKVRGRTADLII